MDRIRTLYTRVKDGCYPVHVTYGNDEVITSIVLAKPEETLTFPTMRKALIAIMGYSVFAARRWTWNRYFRLGQYAPSDRCQGAPIWEALGPGGWLVPGGSLMTTGGLVLIGEEPTLGIDLTKRGREVAKLLYSGFNGKMKAAGYEPNDVLQEVYKGILVRNKGKCPFDARKASFGHYVHMVCHCVLSNYHRRSQRYSGPLRHSLPGGSKGSPLSFGDGEDKSPAVAIDPHNPEVRIMKEAVLSAPYHPQRRLALKMIPYILRYKENDDVWNTASIAANLGVGKAAAAKALTFIRHSLRGVTH